MLSKEYKGTPTWTSWHSMRQRCNDPQHCNWKYYGARGIIVCERWSTFLHFLDDMGERPVGMTLGRKNNDGNYELVNCQWETLVAQNRNTRGVRRESFAGRTMIVTEWAEHFGIDRKQLFNYMRTRSFGEALRAMGISSC